MRTAIRAVLVALLAIGAYTLLPASPAGATEIPGENATPFNNSGDHPWEDNGCSVVPDSGRYGGAYFNFNHACVHHDGCYGGRWASKFDCDVWFWNDMIASCSSLHSHYSYGWLRCQEVAIYYYYGVYYLGWPAYYGYRSDAPMDAYGISSYIAAYA